MHGSKSASLLLEQVAWMQLHPDVARVVGTQVLDFCARRNISA